uniref:6-pyruvoyltetrahydropterin synthase n=1 Tax=Corethron hystrix TaxID=216773 RepID=A0A7S1BLS1_9STRA|mmetsp:Transcript_33338/g.76967  ORF Transcript_33338/g.76967 Transcript_33338/m.76967 type:complete len:181 (+) Transcript_33338:115-657(+)
MKRFFQHQPSASTDVSRIRLFHTNFATFCLQLVLFVAYISPYGGANGKSFGSLPYSLGIRDSFMIAHSFAGNPDFGPAQSLHGATYTCDCSFRCKKLHAKNNWVLDIGYASAVVKEELSKYNFKNLDEMFLGTMTTTEFMSQIICEGIAKRMRSEKNFRGSLEVKLFESHCAWASYTIDI